MTPFLFKLLISLFLISAVPVAFIISMERYQPSGEYYAYRSKGWLREGAVWDDVGHRFIVSLVEGGLGEIRVGNRSGEYEENVIVLGIGMNSSLGLVIDRPRNRILVAISDVIRNRYSAIAAYDLDTLKRLYLTQLNSPGEQTFADDVAVDPSGNAYVTDVRRSVLWKISVNGQLQHPLITSPLFNHHPWHKTLLGLNGVVHHPDGYLLVVHTFSGQLYKVDVNTRPEKVNQVKVNGSLLLGDGIALVSPNKLAVAGNFLSSRLVESYDGWETATVVGQFYGGTGHRVATAVTVKNGKVFLSYVFGLGYPNRKHVIAEAVF